MGGGDAMKDTPLTPTQWRDDVIERQRGYVTPNQYLAMETWTLGQFKMAMNFALNYSKYVQDFRRGA